MATLLKISDFVGVWRISSNAHNSDTLSSYIEQTEADILWQIFETKEIKLSESKWADAWADFGLKEFFLGLTYFNYVRDNFQTATSGKVGLNSANSTPTPREAVYANAVDRFNRAVFIWNEKTLPFFNYWGEVDEEVINTSDSGANWVVECTSLTYLLEGDLVTINGVEYTAENVTATTFTIPNTAPNPMGYSVKYHPFKDFFKLEKIVL